MKGENSIRTAIVLVTSILLVSVMASGVMAGTTQGRDNEEASENYTTREPIRIDGNEDFAEKAEENGWPGDGSEEDPYVIEGYEIDGGGYGYGIYIGNVTDHFVVRECYVHNVSDDFFHAAGIHLLNSQNGRLEENRLYGGSLDEHGHTPSNIELSNSEDNIIINNHIENSSITLYGSSHNLVTQNIIENTDITNISYQCGNGISIINSASELNDIINNTIRNKTRGIFIDYGIAHGESGPEDNNIENNTFINVEREYRETISTEDGGSNGSNMFQTRSFYYSVILLGISIVILGVGWKRVKKEEKDEG